jgi:hypothetical protein
VRPFIDLPGWDRAQRMSNRQRVADQIRHYRQLAQIASDCARTSTAHSSEYLELSRQWFALAARLERDPETGPDSR